MPAPRALRPLTVLSAAALATVLSTTLVAPAGAAGTVTPEKVARKVLKKVDAGKADAASPYATIKVIGKLVKKKNLGYRFDVSNLTCLKGDGVGVFDCSAALYFGKQISGSVFLTVTGKGEELTATAVTVSVGE